LVESRDRAIRPYINDDEHVDAMQADTLASNQWVNPEPESEFVKPYWHDDDYQGMEYEKFNPEPWEPPIVDPPQPPYYPPLEPPDDDDDGDGGGGGGGDDGCRLYPTQSFVGIGAIG